MIPVWCLNWDTVKVKITDVVVEWWGYDASHSNDVKVNLKKKDFSLGINYPFIYTKNLQNFSF